MIKRVCIVLNCRRTFALASDPSFESNFGIANSSDPDENAATLNVKAERCRRLAAGISDKQASDVLNGMAHSYQEAADRLAAPPKKD